MTLALPEWHVVVEAIARGDQVVTLRPGRVDEQPLAVAGSTFWLYPGWGDQQATYVKRAWHGELARSNRERPTDGTIPLRCRCTVEAAWELSDADQLAGLDCWHLWTDSYATACLDWEPGRPLTALLLRAAALIEPSSVPPSATDGDAVVELAIEPPAVDLIPALTDTAFQMRLLAVRDALGEPAGVRA